MLDKKAILSQIQEAFIPEKSTGVNAVIQLKQTGEGGGNYYALIQDQTLTGGEGFADNPRLTISADTMELLDLFHGRLDPMSAYFQGKLSVEGDLGFAMKLAGLFKKPTK
jgi:putative sterol carrier protein